jgi:peptidoglycan/LPS O-acetylase OafA/YrhL
MTYFWWLGYVVGVAFQALVIAALLRGWRREYRVLFAYVVVLFLSTAVGGAAYYIGATQSWASRYYWTIDVVLQAFVFVLVLSFIHNALERRPNKSIVRRMLWLAAGVFVAASLYFTWDPKIGRWMTTLSRNLGFLAVLLNLVLWAVLIQFRRQDRTLLMVSGGMGIQMAGKAIGHSLRQLLYPHDPLPGDLIIVLSHLLCLYIWWQAFRRSDRGVERRA